MTVDGAAIAVPASRVMALGSDSAQDNLRGRSASATLITVGAQAIRFVLTLFSIVILARLLTPEQFGLVAMVTTVTGFLRVFKDAGLSIATVQRDDITLAQISNLFWVNVALGAFMALLVCVSAPMIADFYRDNRLGPIARALSVTFLLTGCAVQHQALLNRQLRFGTIAFIELTAMIASVAAAILLAATGWGYWALVVSAITLEGTALLLTWATTQWRPQWPQPRSGTRALVRFGADLTIGNFVFFLARGLDNVLLGRFYGADAVGLYSRAMALLTRPLEQFLSPISTVFLPVLSRLQSDPPRYRRAFLQINEAIALTGFFFTGILLALAHPITLVLLGQQWEGVAHIFGGFVLAALYAPLSISATWLFTSQGRGKDVVTNSAILSILTALAFVAGLPFGPLGVALAFSASGLFIRLPILYHMAGRAGPVSTDDLWRVFGRHLPVWFVTAGVTSIAHQMCGALAPLVQLLICLPVGAAAGAALIIVLKPQRRVAMGVYEALRATRACQPEVS